MQQSILRVYLSKHYSLSRYQFGGIAVLIFHSVWPLESQMRRSHSSAWQQIQAVLFHLSCSQRASLSKILLTTGSKKLTRFYHFGGTGKHGGVIPFLFESIVLGREEESAEYPKGSLKVGVCPRRNTSPQKIACSVPSDASAPSSRVVDVSQSLNDLYELDEEDSFHDAMLPKVAWSSASESEDSIDPQTTISAEPTDHLLSPPPTELSDHWTHLHSPHAALGEEWSFQKMTRPPNQ